MQYVTITQSVIEQNPALYQRLCQEGTLLPMTLEYAAEFRTIHLSAKAELEKTGLDSQSASSRALEMAVEELQALLNASSQATAPSDA